MEEASGCMDRCEVQHHNGGQEGQYIQIKRSQWTSKTIRVPTYNKTFFFGGSQAGKGEYAVPYLISGSRQHTTCIAQKDKSFVKAMADISDKT